MNIESRIKDASSQSTLRTSARCGPASLTGFCEKMFLVLAEARAAWLHHGVIHNVGKQQWLNGLNVTPGWFIYIYIYIPNHWLANMPLVFFGNSAAKATATAPSPQSSCLAVFPFLPVGTPSLRWPHRRVTHRRWHMQCVFPVLCCRLSGKSQITSTNNRVIH